MAKYKFKLKPYRHQYAAIQRLLKLDWGGALLMEPRTGKTKVAIDFCSIRHQQGHVNRVLIICPVAVVDVWIDEIRINCPFPHTLTIWDRKGRKRTDLPKWGGTKLDFVIINYDAFSTPGSITGRRDDNSIVRSRKKGGRYDVINAFKRWQPQCIILDESHRIKSPSARKATAIVRLGKIADYRLICTGTAVTKAKRTFDLYMQWRFLYPESKLVAGHTAASFRAEYGRWIRVPGEQFDRFKGVRNTGRLHRLVHAESFAVSRDECFDLPPSYPDQLIHVPLEESGKVYDDMAEDMVARISSGEYTEATIRLVQNLRLAQITSGIAKTVPTPEYPDGRLVRVGSEKLRVLKDLCEDWFEEDEKIVICARFRADLFSIQKLAKELGTKSYLLMGGQTRSERTAAITAFRLHQGPAAFIMNPQAGSLGIDLRTASTMVWYSLTNSYVDYTQSRDRIALSGKANRYVFLIAQHTYDEIQYQALQEDRDVVKMIHESPERLLRNFR